MFSGLNLPDELEMVEKLQQACTCSVRMSWGNIVRYLLAPSASRRCFQPSYHGQPTCRCLCMPAKLVKASTFKSWVFIVQLIPNAFLALLQCSSKLKLVVKILCNVCFFV